MLSTLSRRALASRSLLGAASRHVRPTVAPAASFHSGACMVGWCRLALWSVLAS